MENGLQKFDRRPLPKVEDLYADVELASKQNELNRLLNAPPKVEWIKQNKFANNSNYIPVGIVEWLLTSIFGKWRLEIKSTQVIANSVVVAVRLHVLDPITGEWDWQDGIGASPIQTEKDAAATDFSKVNTLAVQMAAPAAETYAFKDAAEKFGKIFGKDINRKSDAIGGYATMLENKFSQILEIPEELKDIIAETTDKDRLLEIYKTNREFHSNPSFLKIINQRKNELNVNGTVNA